MDKFLSHLRAATPADQPFLAALYRSTRGDLAALGEGPAIDDLITMQQKIHESGQHAYYPQAQVLVLQQDVECVARIVLDQNAQRWHLVDMAVLPSARRLGVGSGLLRWMRQGAALANLPLTLNVRKDNLPARGMYLKQGFAVVSEDAVFAQMRWRADGS